MAVTFAWDVSTVDTYPTKDSKADVIYNVHWRLTGTDGVNKDADDNKQTGSTYGSQSLDVSDLSSFTAFGSVSKANAQAWVEAALTSDKVTELKNGIKAQITEKVTPTTVIKTIS